MPANSLRLRSRRSWRPRSACRRRAVARPRRAAPRAAAAPRQAAAPAGATGGCTATDRADAETSRATPCRSEPRNWRSDGIPIDACATAERDQLRVRGRPSGPRTRTAASSANTYAATTRVSSDADNSCSNHEGTGLEALSSSHHPVPAHQTRIKPLGVRWLRILRFDPGRELRSARAVGWLTPPPPPPRVEPVCRLRRSGALVWSSVRRRTGRRRAPAGTCSGAASSSRMTFDLPATGRSRLLRRCRGRRARGSARGGLHLSSSSLRVFHSSRCSGVNGLPEHSASRPRISAFSSCSRTGDLLSSQMSIASEVASGRPAAAMVPK